MRTTGTMRAFDQTRRSAFTLTELMVVVAIILILIGIAIPTISGLTRGANVTAARTMLRGIFTTAKARATSTQQYVAVRFQQDDEGQTYAVVCDQLKDSASYYSNGLLVDPYGGATSHECYPLNYPWSPNAEDRPINVSEFLTFVAASGIEPFKLPKGVEVVGEIVGDDSYYADDLAVQDATTFTIVFSPTGKIVRRAVFITQRWYGLESDPTEYAQTHDTVFNDKWSRSSDLSVRPHNIRRVGFDGSVPDMSQKDYEKMPLLQPDSLTRDASGNIIGPADDRPPSLMPELSQTGLVLYERQDRIDAAPTPYSTYVGPQGIRVQLNLYTGALIDMEQ